MNPEITRMPVEEQREPRQRKKSLWTGGIVSRAVWDSLLKLNPRTLAKNPVMFVVEVGAVITTVDLPRYIANHLPGVGFALQITLWLWFTVLFANFAEAMAEGRGKAQADTLRKARAETMANRMRPDGTTEAVAGSKLRSGDLVVVRAGDFIPGDGEVVVGVASVDESAITGESAPVIRESGGDRSAVTGGTRVLSDEITVKITSNPGETFLDRLIKLVEGAERPKPPKEIALNMLVAGANVYFLAGGRDAVADGDLFGGAAIRVCAHLAPGVSDSNDNWRATFGHRNCGDGSRGAAQRAGDVGARGGSGGRCGYVAAGQDGDNHAGESARDRFDSRAGGEGRRAGGCGAACFAGG
jgi:hypothetical protein